VPGSVVTGVLPLTTLAAIYEHAEQEYPSECCGFVVAGGVRPCINVQDRLHQSHPELHPRTSRQAFALDFNSTRFLMDSFDGDDPVRVIYHSHPDVGAYFSEEDGRFALRDGEALYPSVDYLVIDVRRTGVKGARLFRYFDGSFREVQRYGGLP